uniref:Secreted protein n=1 Tax=Plectus sambesii TaxID=2011161 RepID=A0A914WGA5_9BILA
MNAALLMMFGVFFVTLQVIATANRAEVRAKRNGTEDAIMAKSDVLTRQRRGDISWECTGKCAAYWGHDTAVDHRDWKLPLPQAATKKKDHKGRHTQMSHIEEPDTAASPR